MKETKKTRTSEEVKLDAIAEDIYNVTDDICTGLNKFDPDSETLIPIADKKGRIALAEAK